MVIVMLLLLLVMLLLLVVVQLQVLVLVVIVGAGDVIERDAEKDVGREANGRQIAERDFRLWVEGVLDVGGDVGGRGR